MRFYENEDGFYLLNKDEKTPEGSKLYNIIFTVTMPDEYCYSFPQFELKVKTWAELGYKSKWKITFKNKFEFIPRCLNKEDYLIQLLNDFKLENHEQVMLRHIKDHFNSERYLKIKSEFEEMKSLKETQQPNIHLNEANKHYDDLKDEINKIHKAIKLNEKSISDLQEKFNNKGVIKKMLKLFNIH